MTQVYQFQKCEGNTGGQVGASGKLIFCEKQGCAVQGVPLGYGVCQLGCFGLPGKQ